MASTFYGDPTTSHALLEVLSATGRVPRRSGVPVLARRCYSRRQADGSFDRDAFTQFADALLRATEMRRGLRAYLARLPDREDRLPDDSAYGLLALRSIEHGKRLGSYGDVVAVGRDVTWRS